MIHSAHVLTANGIDLGVWMDAQSEPDLYENKNANEIFIKISCWLNSTEDPENSSTDAPYFLELKFLNVLAYQVCGSELSPYTLKRDNSADPNFIFIVDHSTYDEKKLLKRPGLSWYPKIRKRGGENTFFEELSTWKPTDSLIKVPVGHNHYLIIGHDTYIELLASDFTFEKIMTE